MRVLVTTAGITTDYTPYVIDGSLTVEDSINVPTLVSMQLSPVNTLFQVPKRSSYVQVVSDRYAASGYGSGRMLATGFITSEPERQFMGMSKNAASFGFQHFTYGLKITSDEWILNTQSIPFIPAFINQTDSQILATIANVLMPGFFDTTSLMASGTLVPYYQYDSSQTWSDIAKTFADANRFYYKVINRQIIYQPFGDQPLGISYDDTARQKRKSPLELQTRVVTVPPVNDCIVLGDIEPQNNWDNYFIGDGFTSNFGLRHPVFDGVTNILLQEDWTNPSFSQGAWIVNDPTGVITLTDLGGNAVGALNVVQAGLPGVYQPQVNATYVQAQNGLELGGGLNLQHGQVTFNAACNGIIGGVYGSSTFTPATCLAGFAISGQGSFTPGSAADYPVSKVFVPPGGLTIELTVYWPAGPAGSGNQEQLLTNVGAIGHPPIDPATTRDYIIPVPGPPGVTNNVANGIMYGNYISNSNHGAGPGPSPANVYIPVLDNFQTTQFGGIEMHIIPCFPLPQSVFSGLFNGTYFDWMTADFNPNGVNPSQILQSQLPLVPGNVITTHGFVNSTFLNGQTLAITRVQRNPDGITFLVTCLFPNSTPYGPVLEPKNLTSGQINLAVGSVIVTASGAAGVLIQPMMNGAPVGTGVVSQINHQYLLQTWIGATQKTRFTRPYTNMTKTATYGGQNLTADGTITFVITDVDLGNFVIEQQNPLFGLFPAAPPPVVTKSTVAAPNMPPFALYCLLNAIDLNVSINYTLISAPPQGFLTVQSLTGMSGGNLPWLPSQLSPPIVYQLGFGQQNQTAQVSQQGEAYALSFYTDDIPSVGARIRFQSWAAGQSVARVRDTVAIAQEASISGDSGVRSAIMRNLQPLPRTSDECEAAAGAAILDREYPQFQGTYTVQTIPYRFENMLAPSLYDYPRTGRFFYINATARAITGQNFFVNTCRTQVVEMREEVLTVSLDYGPDLYLEKLLPAFLEREQNLLVQNIPPVAPNPITLPQVLNAHLPTLDKAQITSQVNSLTGNYVTIDLGVAPVSACEVRSVDNGWGNASSQGRVGLFTTQVFTVPRTIRDQTWYLRQINGSQFSRFSKALRVVYPLIPSPPSFVSETLSNLVLGLNGDVRDIYGVKLQAAGVSGTFTITLPAISTINSNPIVTAFRASRIAVIQNPPVIYNSTFSVAAGSNFQVGDIVSTVCPNNPSFAGLKILTDVGTDLATGSFYLHGNVQAYFWNTSAQGGFLHRNTADTQAHQGASLAPVGNPGNATSSLVGNSLMFNPIPFNGTEDPNQQPLKWAVMDANGNITGYVDAWAGATQNYEMALVFQINCPAAGTYGLFVDHDDGIIMAVDSVTAGPFMGNSADNIGHNMTCIGGYQFVNLVPTQPYGPKHIYGNNNSGYYPGEGHQFTVPAAGIYNVEIDFAQWIHEQSLCVWSTSRGQKVLPDTAANAQLGMRISWCDFGQVKPVSLGGNGSNFSAGTVQLFVRGTSVTVTNGLVASGIATVTTGSAHNFHAGDTIVLGALFSTIAPPNADSAFFTGTWTLLSASGSQFSFPVRATDPQNFGSVGLAGRVGKIPAPALPTTVTITTDGLLYERPVFAPSDLVFDFTSQNIQDILQVAQFLSPSGFELDAYFFNLTWDFSAPLQLITTVPTITGLSIDIINQAANWAVTNQQTARPFGYRVAITDANTGTLTNKFTLDNPLNKQVLTQFQMSPLDYTNPRVISVTPYNLYGDGATISISNTGSSISASGQPGGSGGTLVAEIPIVSAAPGPFTIAHNLGILPRVVLIQPCGPGAIWMQTPLRFDALNLYLAASDGNVAAFVEIFI